MTRHVVESGGVLFESIRNDVDPIAAGLTPGTYPVVLKAANGETPDATITFTLTVTSAPSSNTAPTITGPTGMSLTEGYAATSTGVYTIAGNPAPTVTKESGNAAITWNNATKKLDIAAGLAPGTYPVVLKAANGVSPNATVTFTLTVTESTTTQPTQYPIITQPGTWTGNGDVSVIIDADHTKFLRLLKDGAVVDAQNYTITQGSTVITIKESYLKTLADGTHTFRAEFMDGYTDLNLTLKAQSDNTAPTNTPMPATSATDATKNSPQTGDDTNIVIWIALCAAAGGMLFLLWRKNRKTSS